MQQWIPRTQTLEPKIWGQLSLRQGLYIGLGIFAGILSLVFLAPLGVGPRLGGALLGLAAGVTAGFTKIKGLSPERYLFHRLRFALHRQGLGVWQLPEAAPLRVEVKLRSALKTPTVRPKPTAASQRGRERAPSPARVAPAARWGECTIEASPFGLGFHLAALSAMALAIVFLAGWPLP